jgi:hypothetical protein
VSQGCGRRGIWRGGRRVPHLAALADRDELHQANVQKTGNTGITHEDKGLEKGVWVDKEADLHTVQKCHEGSLALLLNAKLTKTREGPLHGRLVISLRG